MTRTFCARLFLVLVVIACAICWSASLSSAGSPRLRTIRAGSLTAQQSPSPTPAPIHNGTLPVVSPDGLRIACTSDRGGADDLFVVSEDGSNERQLTHTPEAEGYFFLASHFETNPSVRNSPLSFPSCKAPVMAIDSCFLKSRVKLNLPLSQLPSRMVPGPVCSE